MATKKSATKKARKDRSDMTVATFEIETRSPARHCQESRWQGHKRRQDAESHS